MDVRDTAWPVDENGVPYTEAEVVSFAQAALCIAECQYVDDNEFVEAAEEALTYYVVPRNGGGAS